jgi:hypothetical protein
VEHGCTVHRVSEEPDAGEIVASARVPVLPGDTPDTLAARVLQAEHRLYPATLRVAARLSSSQVRPHEKVIFYTKHAFDSMIERDLDPEWVERTARKPDHVEPDPFRPGVERRFKAIPEFGGRVLRVACLETRAELRIVTVFFDRKARRRR